MNIWFILAEITWKRLPHALGLYDCQVVGDLDGEQGSFARHNGIV